ncbi:hypothetical protein Q3C01_09610 [Bradyrhizobium sp. UFLA05-109]
MSHRRSRTTRMLASAILLAGNLLTLPAAAQPQGVTRTDLRRHDLSVGGHEAVQTVHAAKNVGRETTSLRPISSKRTSRC